MAIGGKSTIGNETADSGFQAAEIARFLKSKKLDSFFLILLDTAIPFKRPLSAFISVAEPLFSIVMGHENAGRLISSARNEDFLESLTDALERGEK